MSFIPKFIKVEEIYNPITGTNFEVVRKPEACVLAVFNNDYTKILLIQEWRAGKADLSWGSPSGIMDSNELPLDCALREAHEEIGVNWDKFKDVRKIGTFLTSAGYSTEKHHVFVCSLDEDVEFGETNFDENEFIVKKKWFEIDEAKKILDSYSTNYAISQVELFKFRGYFIE